MRVWRGLPPARGAPRGRVVATIGVFDGVHRGHQAILRETLAAARATGALPLVITFDRHPLATLAPRLAPRSLMTLDQRLAGMAALGFPAACVLRFDRRLAALPAEAFVRRALTGRLHLAHLIVGYDFHFGRGGRGDAVLLAKLGSRLGFGVAVVPPVLAAGEPISSTRIRRLVALGAMPAAARLLGRPLALTGLHRPGRRLARRLGFPTINLQPENELLPPFGVYAVAVGDAARPAVANLGVRPTVDRRRRLPLLEVHTLGTPPASRPGRRHQVALIRFLRPERKFQSLSALARQITRDVAAARRALHLTGSAGRG